MVIILMQVGLFLTSQPLVLKNTADGISQIACMPQIFENNLYSKHVSGKQPSKRQLWCRLMSSHSVQIDDSMTSRCLTMEDALVVVDEYLVLVL